MAQLIAEHLRANGLCRTLLGADWETLDETALVYDQAFVMLALAMAKAAKYDEPPLETRAVKVRDHLRGPNLPNDAVVEAGDDAYQSNCHMHLLEAFLAWEELGRDIGWAELTDQIVALARPKLIDAKGGFQREFFGPDWTSVRGIGGRLIKPGRQVEWAWLLIRYGLSRGDCEILDVARRLYAHGANGVSELLDGVVNAMNVDGTIRSRRARLWPNG